MTAIPQPSKEQNVEQIEGQKRLLKAYEIYNTLSERKKEDFKEVREDLFKILEKLFQEGKIERGTAVLSRIKSPESVVKNWRLGKKIDDIFGISIVVNSPEEIEQIRAEIRQQNQFNICSRKERNEKRGYEAIHFSLQVKDNKKKTKVECHLQTHEAYKNVYPHIFYKVRRELERDLTPNEENIISTKVQTMYEKDELGGYHLSGGKRSRIPQMWVSSFNPDGKMEEIELDEDIILTIMYPSLDISKNRNTVTSSTQTHNEEVEL